MEKEKPLVMIVDDEPDMCWALENILRQNGFRSEKALSGQSAMKLMKRHKYYLAFLDVKLTDMEGLDLARLIKSVDPDIRIIMISGFCYKDDPTIQEAIQEGLVGNFVAKPFLHNDILDSIKTASSSARIASTDEDSVP
jgi:DNA-binding NtrC family response regulator